MSDLVFAGFFFCLGFGSCAAIWFFRAKIKSEAADVIAKVKDKL